GLEAREPVEPSRPETETERQILPPRHPRERADPQSAEAQRPLRVKHSPRVLRRPAPLEKQYEPIASRLPREADRRLDIAPIGGARGAPGVGSNPDAHVPVVPQVPPAVGVRDDRP